MRKIILFAACSLDGFIAGKNGDVSWLFSDRDYGYRKFLTSVDTAIMGRKTYEKGLELGDKFEGKKYYVFARKKRAKKIGGVEFVSDVVRFTKNLRKEKGKNIWLVGGGEIISILMNANLVDEVMIFVHPVILGKGVPLFPSVKKRVRMELVKTKGYKSGLVMLRYNVL